MRRIRRAWCPSRRCSVPLTPPLSQPRPGHRRTPSECLLHPSVCCGASLRETLGWHETLGWRDVRRPGRGPVRRRPAGRARSGWTRAADRLVAVLAEAVDPHARQAQLVCRHHVVVVPLGDVDPAPGGGRERLLEAAEVAEGGLVGPDVLGRDDGVDDDAEAALRGADDVAVAVREQRQAPAAGAQRAELGGDLGERRPVRDRRAEDRGVVVEQRQAEVAGGTAQRLGHHVAVAHRRRLPPRRRARGRCSARAARRRVPGTAGRPTWRARDASRSACRSSRTSPSSSHPSAALPRIGPGRHHGRRHGAPASSSGTLGAMGTTTATDAEVLREEVRAWLDEHWDRRRCRARSGWSSSSMPATPCRRGRPSGSAAASTARRPR